MKYANLNDAFKDIIIDKTFKSISSLFLNAGNSSQINYQPPYQREYVWPPFKAAYFIESVLLHAEFHPIVTFERNGIHEVIDGRQRCETIDRFLKNQLTLKGSGLEKLWYLANKKYSQIGNSLQQRFADAKIRVITIKFKNEENIDPHLEELIKREFFRRYNLGITPLKKEEVYKAQYLQDDINLYFKKRFRDEPNLYAQVKDLFEHKSRNIEVQLQGIRQLLVLHKIPLNRFISERDDIVNKYYDYLSYENNGNEKVRPIFDAFKQKLSALSELKDQLDKEIGKSNGLIYECLYWAFSIIEIERVKSEKINAGFKNRLVKYLANHIKSFSPDRSNHTHQVIERYRTVAEFFSSQLHVSFERYMKNNDFVVADKKRMDRYMQERFSPGLEQDYFSKTTPTSSSIADIISRMKKHKFNIRPPYQRKEVPDKIKASSLIESVLKHIQLHPIYVYVRKDGVSEVIDGQQRLLAIIGFMGEHYLDEHGNLSPSVKHRFSLNLKTGLLQELHGKKYADLSEELQRKIQNFNIDIIEIREENNPTFKPEELFKRLNYKPCPIKEHSFEFWNAYADSEIIKLVKSTCQKYPWVYLRKANTRMMNQELMMYFIYFNCVTNKTPLQFSSIKEVLTIHLWGEKVNIQIKSKPQITRILENDKRRLEFLDACKTLEPDFLDKLTVLTSSSANNSDAARNRHLDKILHTKGPRTLLKFYLLWIILEGISIQTISNFRPAVIGKIDEIFQILSDAKTVDEFETAVIRAWASLKKNVPLPAMAAV